MTMTQFEEVKAKLLKQSSHEPEFIQAVDEVLESLQLV